MQVDWALSFAVQFQFSPKTLCFRNDEKTKMGRSVHWGITRDAWTPGLKNQTKMPRKKGTKNWARCSNGANSWCRRIYNEDPRHLCHINHPPLLVPLSVSLCFQRKKSTTASVFVPIYSTGSASKICRINIIATIHTSTTTSCHNIET